MFTIGKLSQLVKVSPRMLRYYEKLGLFYPYEIDTTNGYRLYHAEQIPLLLRIVSLRDMGFSVEEIIDFVDHIDDMNYLINVHKNKEIEIKQDIQLKKRQLDMLDFNIAKLINNNHFITCDLVEVINSDTFTALTLRTTIDNYEQQEQIWNDLAQKLTPEQLQYPMLTIYHGFTENDQIDIEIGVILDDAPRLFDSMLVVSVRCIGPLEHVLPEGEASCLKWVQENGYEIIGPERILSYQHPMNQPDNMQFVTIIQYPIRKKEVK